MIRRQSSLDRPSGDIPERLLRWGVGLLSPRRAEWGQAMLGELDHIDGRTRRLRFALGCVIGALLLPPWGAAAAGVGAILALAIGAAGVFVSVVGHYGLGGGGQVAAGIVMVFLVGFLLGASALVRRPGVAVPGLLGLLIAVTATVGWGRAAAAGPIVARLRPTTDAVAEPSTPRSVAVARGVRLVVLSAVALVAVVLAFVSWLRGY